MLLERLKALQTDGKELVDHESGVPSTCGRLQACSRGAGRSFFVECQRTDPQITPFDVRSTGITCLPPLRSRTRSGTP